MVLPRIPLADVNGKFGSKMSGNMSGSILDGFHRTGPFMLKRIFLFGSFLRRIVPCDPKNRNRCNATTALLMVAISTGVPKYTLDQD